MKKNLFKLGKNNKDFQKLIFEYLKDNKNANALGLCGGVFVGPRYEIWFKQQKPFKLDSKYPVEAAILKSQKKSIQKAEDMYFQRKFTNPKKASGRLRIWWAYNLVVAISNMPESERHY